MDVVVFVVCFVLDLVVLGIVVVLVDVGVG